MLAYEFGLVLSEHIAIEMLILPSEGYSAVCAAAGHEASGSLVVGIPTHCGGWSAATETHLARVWVASLLTADEPPTFSVGSRKHGLSYLSGWLALTPPEIEVKLVAEIKKQRPTAANRESGGDQKIGCFVHGRSGSVR